MAINILNKSGLEHFWDNLKKAFIWKPEERVLNGYLKLTSTGVVWETLPGLLRYKGECTWENLPSASSANPPAEGDVWTVTDQGGEEYFYKYYDDTLTYDWEPMGALMSNYLKKLKAGDLIKLEPGTGPDAGKEVISVDIPTEINKLLYFNGNKFTAEELMCKYQYPENGPLSPVVFSQSSAETDLSVACSDYLPANTVILFKNAVGGIAFKIIEDNNERSKQKIEEVVLNNFNVLVLRYFPGSRLSYNPATKKLFYSDGSSIIRISNNYELPIASASTLGGVKIGAGLTINSLTGVLSTSGSYLPLSGGTLTGLVYYNQSETPTTAVACTKKYNYLTQTSNTTLTITAPSSLSGPCEVIYAVKNGNASGGSNITLTCPTTMTGGTVHNMIGESSFTVAPGKIAELVFTFWSTTEVSFNGGVEE